MNRKKCDFSDEKLKNKVKNIIKKSKDLNIIKSHIVAFDENPVDLEQYKGSILSYYQK